MNLILPGILITLITGFPVLMQLRKHHPRGLIILFLTEMWERFSYYGMRALLIFYLTQHLLFDDARANAQYGSYTSLIYLLPLMGGILADRWLGTRKAVAFGAVLLVAGHLTMGIEGKPAQQTLSYAGQTYEVQTQGRMETRQVRLMIGGKGYEFGPARGDGQAGGLEIKDLPVTAPLPAVLPAGAYALTSVGDKRGEDIFYLAISLIILGVGFLKSNVAALAGQLYPQGDPRRDPGFTLYYYGMNLGSFWAAVLCGVVGTQVGWWAGFGLAGLGMLAGLVIFLWGRRFLEGKGEPPNPAQLAAPFVGAITREHLIYGAGLLAVLPVWWLVQRNAVVGVALQASALLAFLAIAGIVAFACKTWADRKRMMLAVVLIVGATIFWTLFEQAGSSLNLFAARNVDLGAVSAAQTQSFNSGFILIFAPILAALWTWLGRRGRDFDPTLKFGLALIQVGLGFLVIVWGAGMADATFRMPLVFLVILYLLHTTGELFLSPVGLSQISRLSLPTVASFMMAAWYLSNAMAQYVAGIVAGMASTQTIGGQVLDPAAAFAASLKVFNLIGWWGAGLGAAFIVLSFFIKDWSSERAAVPLERET
jgi:POT family proton-dependent oligopeptide transporter